MRKWLVWLTSALFVMPLMIGLACVTVGSHSERVKSLGDADSGEEISIVVGEEFEVKLEANYTTGYHWDVAEMDESVLELVAKNYKLDTRYDPPPPGTGGTLTLRFKALSAGQTSLKLVYHQSWEDSAGPARNFEIQVNVQE
ncbi:MAG: protease inhibitor I42 family protein [Chloroflexota bacterium]|nr:protease inhibitor I42 family protein [Chloroflexota bacterium]